MFKNVLVPLTDRGVDRIALSGAHALLREDGGHIRCLYVHDDAAAMANAIQTDAMGVPFVTPEFIAALSKEAEGQKKRAKQIFEAFCKQHGLAVQDSGQTPLSASWQEANGDVVATISKESGFVDAVVMARDGDFAEPSPHDIGSVVISSGRPVILIPPDWQPRMPQRIAIAWKDTPEAARAVTAALPILEKTTHVSVFCVAETFDLEAAKKSARKCGDYLKSHGIVSESAGLNADKTDVAAVLFSEARRTNADLLVLGAYGHSRLREFVFGGLTRAALFEAPIPVLLMH